VAFDRVLATRFGVAAVEAVADGALGEMVALQAGSITRVAVADAVGHLKTVDEEMLRTSAIFQVPYDRT
jgi:6-phosphofructokinase 1